MEHFDLRTDCPWFYLVTATCVSPKNTYVIIFCTLDWRMIDANQYSHHSYLPSHPEHRKGICLSGWEISIFHNLCKDREECAKFFNGILNVVVREGERVTVEIDIN